MKSRIWGVGGDPASRGVPSHIVKDNTLKRISVPLCVVLCFNTSQDPQLLDRGDLIDRSLVHIRHLEPKTRGRSNRGTLSL